MSSAILSVCWPERFSIYDYRVCEEVRGWTHLATIKNPHAEQRKHLHPHRRTLSCCVSGTGTTYEGACGARPVMSCYPPQPRARRARARYVLICMEPSLGRWARSAEEGKSEGRSRSELSVLEEFILHFATSRYPCEPGERYHITDMSKGAMVVNRAAMARLERYDRWYPLLLEELHLVAAPDADIVAVGGAVAEHLALRGFQQPFTRIMRYSGQAGPCTQCSSCRSRR